MADSGAPVLSAYAHGSDVLERLADSWREKYEQRVSETGAISAEAFKDLAGLVNTEEFESPRDHWFRWYQLAKEELGLPVNYRQLAGWVGLSYDRVRHAYLDYREKRNEVAHS
jgi:hypothetical protein